jgi:hypothetical protein
VKLPLSKCLFLISVLLTAGCAALKAYPDRSVSIDDQLRNLTWCFDPSSEKPPASGVGLTAWRNEVVNCRIRAIDLQFTSFEQSIARENIGLNTGADIVVLGLGAATALTGGAGTKSILGAISGGVIGTKGIIDKDVFYSKTMPALLTQMEAQRKSQLVKIRNGLKLPVETYPLSEALIDVEEYFKAGSIPAALQGIIEQAGAAGRDATTELKRIQPASAIQVEQISAVRSRFNTLIQTWKKTPDSEDGKKAMADAKSILKKLRPADASDGERVFIALDEEIQRSDPGSEQFKRVREAFAGK